jgi:hypothetical protein
MNSNKPTSKVQRMGKLYRELSIAEFFEQDREDSMDFDIDLRMSLDKGDIQDIFDYARFN